MIKVAIGTGGANSGMTSTTDGLTDEQVDAVSALGYKVESKYYYKYLKTGAADVLAEKWHFFRPPMNEFVAGPKKATLPARS